MTRTILLFHDKKEKVVAKSLMECTRVLTGYDPKIELILSNSDEELRSCMERLGGEGGRGVIFVLCSPYSISRSWINFASGAATIWTDKKQSTKAKIIPICHAGQKANHLPHYLLSRQALDIWHKYFVDALYATLQRELKICEGKTIPLNHCRKRAYLDLLREPQYVKAENNGSRDISQRISTDSSLAAWQLSRAGRFLTIAERSETKTGKSLETEGLSTTTKQIYNFLNGQEPLPISVPIAIGWQYCLVDGEGEFFIGLKSPLAIDDDYAAYSKDTGMFEPGYEIVTKGETPDAVLQRLHERGFQAVPLSRSNSDHKAILDQIQESGEAIGQDLWDLTVGGGSYLASIFVNRYSQSSQLLPKLEIGIWTILDLQGASHSDLHHYWIWVRRGEVHYWTYPDLRSIPRLKPLSDDDLDSLATINPNLVTRKQLCEHFWRLDRYTPFASDDVQRTYGELVGTRFSAAASSLLSCY